MPLGKTIPVSKIRLETLLEEHDMMVLHRFFDSDLGAVKLAATVDRSQ